MLIAEAGAIAVLAAPAYVMSLKDKLSLEKQNSRRNMNKLTEKEVRKEFKEHPKIKFLQSVGPTQTEHFMNGVPNT